MDTTTTITEIFPTTPLAPVKFEGGWALGRKGSDVLTFDDNGQPFPTRDAARKASKIIAERVQRDREAFEAAAPATVEEGAETLAAAQAKIAELAAQVEALKNAADSAAVGEVAEEVIIALPSPIALPDGRRRATHYERDAMGQAAYNSAASQAGERVTYPPYAWGGEAHRAIAAALANEGFTVGSPVAGDDLACVPGLRPNQARWGSPASRNTARHRMANAGMLVRIAGGKRGLVYTIAPDFFSPETWEAHAAAQMADRREPVATV